VPAVERERRTNNFDALRITAALCVIVGHSFVLTNRTELAPSLGGAHLEYLGVSVFFVISGYLITGSWERSRSVGQYVSSRALRIAPLLFLVILLSTFVMGPLVTTAPDYFANPETWRYLVNLVLLPADGLPGVFESNPLVAVNGSVWTLRAEVICYLIVLLLGLLPRVPQLIGFALFAAGSAVLVAFDPVIVAGSNVSAAGGTWVYFAVAALVRLLVPRGALRPGIAAVVAVVWVVVSLVAPSIAIPLLWLALPYVVLSFGLASTPGLRRAARFGDLSYGLYLWAFPVQQLVVLAFGILPLAIDIPLVALVTAALAFGSWHLLEKPALAARLRLPWFRSATSRPR
jgi:peptidoglycan/LPS O-acetylase OafA/YrhL